MLAFFVFGFLGLIVGSFLNVLILRHGQKSLRGRSVCLSCEKVIHWYDNIPLFSWVMLRGRCRSCGSAISIQYPLVELSTALLFALVAHAYLDHASLTVVDQLRLLTFVVPLSLMMATLIALGVYDIRHTILPDTWVYAFCVIALTWGIVNNVSLYGFWIEILSGPAIALPLFVLWFLSRGRWMGFGDVKLTLGIGWLLGPLYGFLALMYAFMLGALVSVSVFMLLPHLVRYMRKQGIVRFRTTPLPLTMRSEVPFGPFLITSTIFVWFALIYNIPISLWF